MTREEEIKQAAQAYYPSGSLHEERTVSAFVRGAKWADENPNLYNNEKYHTVKVSCLDELNRKAVLYDAFLEKLIYGKM